MKFQGCKRDSEIDNAFNGIKDDIGKLLNGNCEMKMAALSCWIQQIGICIKFGRQYSLMQQNCMTALSQFLKNILIGDRRLWVATLSVAH